MLQMSTQSDPQQSHLGNSASNDSGSAAGAEWRVTKDQLAAAERASRYHAQQSRPSLGATSLSSAASV